MIYTPESVPCGTCGTETFMTGTKRCDSCYEVESRLSGYLLRGGEKARQFVESAMARRSWRSKTPAETKR